MTNYGFDDDEDFTPPVLPKRKVSAPKAAIQTAVRAGKEIGFVSRGGEPSLNVSAKDRRIINKEPQGKVLVTGPERVIERLRQISIESNQPYWKVIEQLLDSSQ